MDLRGFFSSEMENVQGQRHTSPVEHEILFLSPDADSEFFSTQLARLSLQADWSCFLKCNACPASLILQDFPGGSVVKNLPANAGDMGSIPGSGRSLGEGNSNPCQYSCWEIPQTEEPGWLQSMESQRVGCDWATFNYCIIYTSKNISSSSRHSIINSKLVTCTVHVPGSWSLTFCLHKILLKREFQRDAILRDSHKVRTNWTLSIWNDFSHLWTYICLMPIVSFSLRLRFKLYLITFLI